MTSTWQAGRDYVGYAGNPPDPQWPNGARMAINFVMNYEEGSEASVLDGDEITDTNMTEAHGVNQPLKGRDLAAESMFEYGSRVGFWRLMRLFQERGLPLDDLRLRARARAQCAGGAGHPRSRVRRLLPWLALAASAST